LPRGLHAWAVRRPFREPERLFALAERTGRLVRLERLCRKRGPPVAGPPDREGLPAVSSTPPPRRCATRADRRRVPSELADAGLDAETLVLELAERAAVEERRTYLEALRQLKGRGVGVAIDDMGAGYSSLQAVVELEPDYLKFDIALVRGIDRSQIKRSLLETVVELSQKIGAEVIAEGIESESELQTIRDLGVRLGQGCYLAPPLPAIREVLP